MKKEEKRMNKLKSILSKKRNYKFFILFMLISFLVVFLACNHQQNILIEKSTLFSEGRKEVYLADNINCSYSVLSMIHKIDKENFTDYSTLNYPSIKMNDTTENKEIEERINQLLLEMVMLHYQDDLEQQVNAVYACDYLITHADEAMLCIYFTTTIGAGMGRPTTYSDAVTISLKTGKKISLDEFGDVNTLLKKINNYSGVIYSDTSFFDKDKWMENKEQLIESWKSNEDLNNTGYYLYEGRIGLLFDYYYTGNEKIALEFEGIV